MSGRSFFLRGKKNSQTPASKEKAARFNDRKFEKKKRSFHQEEIDSDEEVGDMEINESDVVSKKHRGLLDDADEGSGSDVDETAQQKRLRLAESYLRERAEAIEQEYDEDDEQDEEERDTEVTGALSRRLEDEILDQQGKLIQRIADSIKLLQATKQKRKETQESFVCDAKESYPDLHCVTLRGHRRAVTSVALSANGEFVFSGAKDGSLCKWNALTGQRERLVCRLVSRSQRGGGSAKSGKQKTDGNKKPQESGHKHAVLAVAASCDDRFVASGDARGTILVWTFAELRCLRALTGHRGAITALSFRKVPFSAATDAKGASGGTKRKQDEAAHTLFSASADRTVKQWDVDQLAYVDTMLGHEDAVTGLDALFAERCVTSGGRDASVRVFKPALESQLVFHGDGAAVECVAALSDRFFVSGSDRNCVSLWNVMRKKPIQTIVNAHSAVAESSNDQGESHAFDAGDSNHDIWISAIAALPNSDVFATGARDGYVRVWQCKVDADGVAEAGDGETPSRRRITLSNNWRRQQSENLRGVRPTPLILVPIRGVVNSLSMRLAPAVGSTTDTDELVVAVAAAREHKAGRWWKVRDAQNVVKVFRFTLDKRARLASANGAGQPV